MAFSTNLAGCGWIALGGAVGALTRYAVTLWVTDRVPGSTFPWGTFIINMSGSFIIGLALTLIGERVLTSPSWRPFVITGFVGAYTTFSTFEYESAKLGAQLSALGNLVGSVVAGYGCVWLGIRCGMMLAGAFRV